MGIPQRRESFQCCDRYFFLILAKNIGFGISKSKYISTFSKVKAAIAIQEYSEGAFKYMNTSRPFELVDLQAMVVQEGIIAPTSIAAFGGMPITLLASRIEAKLVQRVSGGAEYVVCDAFFDNFHLGTRYFLI